jgi:hypothetical protein
MRFLGLISPRSSINCACNNNGRVGRRGDDLSWPDPVIPERRDQVDQKSDQEQYDNDEEYQLYRIAYRWITSGPYAPGRSRAAAEDEKYEHDHEQ